jgi:hypothetical protein
MALTEYDLHEGDHVRISIEATIWAVYETGYLVKVDGEMISILKSDVVEVMEKKPRVVAKPGHKKASEK